MRRWVVPLALCLALCACAGPEREEPPAPAEEESGELQVRTDWSRLGEREAPPEPVGSRWYEDWTGELIPREDYGMLIPYAGQRLMDDWPAANGCLYGLMTREGAVVTDPVYSAVYRPSGCGGDPAPLVLKRGDESAGAEQADPALYAAAAGDGSWCTPFEYLGVAANDRGLLLFQRDGFTMLSPEGAVQRIWTLEEMGVSREEYDAVLNNLAWGEGWSGSRKGDYMALDWDPESDYERLRCFNLETGEVRVFSDEAWYALEEEPIWEGRETVIPDASFLADSLLDLDAPGLLALTEYGDTDTTITYYREDGTPLPELTQRDWQWYQQVNVVGGLVEVLDLDTASYYDLETMECVFRTYLRYGDA